MSKGTGTVGNFPKKGIQIPSMFTLNESEKRMFIKKIIQKAKQELDSRQSEQKIREHFDKAKKEWRTYKINIELTDPELARIILDVKGRTP